VGDNAEFPASRGGRPAEGANVTMQPRGAAFRRGWYECLHMGGRVEQPTKGDEQGDHRGNYGMDEVSTLACRQFGRPCRPPEDVGGQHEGPQVKAKGNPRITFHSAPLQTHWPHKYRP
jgi:hypothetical protein